MKILILQEWNPWFWISNKLQGSAVLLVHGPQFENLGLKSRQDWGQRTKTGPQRGKALSYSVISHMQHYSIWRHFKMLALMMGIWKSEILIERQHDFQNCQQWSSLRTTSVVGASQHRQITTIVNVWSAFRYQHVLTGQSGWLVYKRHFHLLSLV